VNIVELVSVRRVDQNVIAVGTAHFVRAKCLVLEGSQHMFFVNSESFDLSLEFAVFLPALFNCELIGVAGAIFFCKIHFVLIIHLISRSRKVLLEGLFEIKRIGFSAHARESINEQPETEKEKRSSWVNICKIKVLGEIVFCYRIYHVGI